MNLNIFNIIMLGFIVATIISGIYQTIRIISGNYNDHIQFDGLFAQWEVFIFCRVIELGLIALFSIPLINKIEEIGGIYVRTESEATVISVGYQGVVVEYSDVYGKEKSENELIIPHDELDKYHSGDNVTIQIENCIFFNTPEIKGIYVSDNGDENKAQEVVAEALEMYFANGE